MSTRRGTPVMLEGDTVRLRPVLESDLDGLYALLLDVDDRGPWYPLGVTSQAAFRREWHETGFWHERDGLLLILDREDRILGDVGYFRTVDYLDELELHYRIFAPEDRGKGSSSEALRMLVRYLFDSRPVNRLRLVIHPDNAASRRVAEKCGFRQEGIARGAWHHRGRHQDVEVWALVRADLEAAGATTPTPPAAGS